MSQCCSWKGCGCKRRQPLKKNKREGVGGRRCNTRGLPNSIGNTQLEGTENTPGTENTFQEQKTVRELKAPFREEETPGNKKTPFRGQKARSPLVS